MPQQARHVQSGLLKLPGELRNTIYRCSLLSDKPLAVGNDGSRLPSTWTLIRNSSVSVQLLAVCRQIFNEASNIFYGENTFASIIYGDWAIFGPHGQLVKAWEVGGIPLHKTRRWKIIVEWSPYDSFSHTRLTVQDTALALARIPHLVQVNLHLQVGTMLDGTAVQPSSSQPNEDPHLLLEPFSILRNIGSVTFDERPEELLDPGHGPKGTPQEYAETLKTIMEGPPHSKPLPEMFRALRDYTLSSKDFDADVWHAYVAVMDGDCEEFERVAQEIVNKVDAELASCRAEIFAIKEEVERYRAAVCVL